MLGGDEAAVQRYTQSGFTDLNAGNEPTTIRQESFDRIFMRSAQSEFMGSEQAVFGRGYLSLSSNPFLRRFSDHYMVTANVKVGTDDDQ